MKLQFLCLLALWAVAAVTDAAPTESSDLVAVGSRALEVLANPAAPFNDDVETAKQALDVIKNFIEIFNSDIFATTGVKKVAEIVSKIFSFVISIINLAQGIEPEESEEMKLREQFAEVHNKLDSISLQLDDVKRLIEWQTTRVMYAQYESFIMATSHLLNAYVSAPKEESEVLKRQFVDAFRSNHLATLSLYQAVVETDFVISSNLAAAAVHYTQKHRRHTMNFLLALQRLIMRGAQLEIAYEKIEHGDIAASHTKDRWDGLMMNLLTRMQQVETSVKNDFQEQVASDVDRLILEHRYLSNHDFGLQMYNFVADKFEWRYWFSLAYDDVSGYNEHALSSCDTHSVIRLRAVGGRNVVVVSSDPATSRFYPDMANTALDAAQQDGSGSHAKSWSDLIRSKLTDYNCNEIPFVGAICVGCNVWFKGEPGQFVHRRISKDGDINVIIFG